MDVDVIYYTTLSVFVMRDIIVHSVFHFYVKTSHRVQRENDV